MCCRVTFVRLSFDGYIRTEEVFDDIARVYELGMKLWIK